MTEDEAVKLLTKTLQIVRSKGLRPRIRVGLPSPESMDLHIEDIYFVRNTKSVGQNKQGSL